MNHLLKCFPCNRLFFFFILQSLFIFLPLLICVVHSDSSVKKLQTYEITHDYVLDLILIFCFQVNEAKPREGGGGGGGYGGGRGGGRGDGYGGGRGGGGYGGGTV